MSSQAQELRALLLQNGVSAPTGATFNQLMGMATDLAARANTSANNIVEQKLPEPTAPVQPTYQSEDEREYYQGAQGSNFNKNYNSAQATVQQGYQTAVSDWKASHDTSAADARNRDFNEAISNDAGWTNTAQDLMGEYSDDGMDYMQNTKEGLRFQDVMQASGNRQYMKAFTESDDFERTLSGAAANTFQNMWDNQLNVYKKDTAMNYRQQREATDQYFSDDDISAESIYADSRKNWFETQNAFRGVQTPFPSDEKAFKAASASMGKLLSSSTRNTDVTGSDSMNPNNYGGGFTKEFDSSVKGGNATTGWSTSVFTDMAKEYVNFGDIQAPSRISNPAEQQQWRQSMYEKQVGIKANVYADEYNAQARGLAASMAGGGKVQSYADVPAIPDFISSAWQIGKQDSKEQKKAKYEMKAAYSSRLKGYNKSIGIGGSSSYKEDQRGLSGSNAYVLPESANAAYARDARARRKDFTDNSFVASGSLDDYSISMSERMQASGVTKLSGEVFLKNDATQFSAGGDSTLDKWGDKDLGRVNPTFKESNEAKATRDAVRRHELQMENYNTIDFPTGSPMAQSPWRPSNQASMPNSQVNALYDDLAMKQASAIPSVAAMQEQGFKASRGAVPKSPLMEGINATPSVSSWGEIARATSSVSLTAAEKARNDLAYSQEMEMANQAAGEVVSMKDIQAGPNVAEPNQDVMSMEAEASRIATGKKRGATTASIAAKLSSGQLTPMNTAEQKYAERFMEGQMGSTSDNINYGSNLQGSSDWLYDDRAGLQTGSTVGSILKGGAEGKRAVEGMAYNALAGAPYAGPRTNIEALREQNAQRFSGPFDPRMRKHSGELDFEAGHRLEDVAKSELSKKYGKINSAGLVTRDSMPGLGASPDGIMDVGDELLEIKAPREFKPATQEYIDQMQLGMHVMDKKSARFAQIVEDEFGNTQIREQKFDRDEDWYKNNKDAIEEGRDNYARTVAQNAPADLSHLSSKQRGVVEEARARVNEITKRETRERVEGNVEESQAARRGSLLEDVNRTVESTKPTSAAERKRREASLNESFGGRTAEELADSAKMDAKHTSAIIEDRKRTRDSDEATAKEQAKAADANTASDDKQVKEDAKLQREVNTAWLAAIQSGSMKGTGQGAIQALQSMNNPYARALGGLGAGAVAGLGLATDIAETITSYGSKGMNYGADIYTTQGNNLALRSSGMSEQGASQVQDKFLNAQLMLKKGHSQHAAEIAKNSQGLFTVEDIASGKDQITLIRNAVNKGKAMGWSNGQVQANLVDALGPEAGKMFEAVSNESADAVLTDRADKAGNSAGAIEGILSVNEQQTSLTGTLGLKDAGSELLLDTAGSLGDNAGLGLDATTIGVTAATTAAGVGAWSKAKGLLKGKVPTGPAGAAATGGGRMAAAKSIAGRAGAIGTAAYLGTDLYQSFEDGDGGKSVMEGYGIDFLPDIMYDTNWFDGMTNEERAAKKPSMDVAKVANSVSSPYQAKAMNAQMQLVTIDVNLNIKQDAIDAEVSVDGETRQRQSINNYQIGRYN
jgi:hypothetical protein